MILLCLLSFKTNAQVSGTSSVKQAIITNKNFDSVQVKAIKLLSGFSAGTSYNEIWIRDFNTFIKGSLKAHPKEEVKNMVLIKKSKRGL